MNSVARARALSVKGSAVESVRVPNDTVNMLLQVAHRILSDSHVHTKTSYVLQSIATDEVRWVNR
jgi:hypothetical protein